MASPTVEKLRGLVLSAVELREMTDWPSALIEDYLDIFNSIVLLAEEIDTKNSIIKNTTLVITPVYQIEATDEEIFFDTTAAGSDIQAQLPKGVDGTNYRLINVGDSDYRVIIIPFAGDKLVGELDTEYLADSEVLIITFENTVGWW